MSYSFGVRGSSKADAIKKVAEQLAETVKTQPMHVEDQKQAQAAAESIIGLLVVDTTKDVMVSMSGSLSKSRSGTTGANVNVSASIVAKA
jgi:hypothetical protein